MRTSIALCAALRVCCVIIRHWWEDCLLHTLLRPCAMCQEVRINNDNDKRNPPRFYLHCHDMHITVDFVKTGLGRILTRDYAMVYHDIVVVCWAVG